MRCVMVDAEPDRPGADRGGARPLGAEPGPVRGRHAAAGPGAGRRGRGLGQDPGAHAPARVPRRRARRRRRSRSSRSRSPTRPRARCRSGSPQLVGPVGRRMWVSTFHAACSRILRREASLLGYRSSFTIYDQADAHAPHRLGAPRPQPRPEALPGPPAARADQRAEERARAARASTREMAVGPAERRLAEIYTEYQRRLAGGVGRRLRRPARARRAPVPRAPRSARALPQPLPARARRRVPGHERRAVGARAPPHRRTPQRHGRRRPAISASSPAPQVTMGDGSTQADRARRAPATRCCRATAAATSAPRASCARTSRARSRACRSRSRAAGELVSTPEHVHFAGVPTHDAARRIELARVPRRSLLRRYAGHGGCERASATRAMSTRLRVRDARSLTASRRCRRRRCAGHGHGRRARRVRRRRRRRVGGDRRAGLRPRRRADAQLRRQRHRHAQLDLQVPRGGLPELDEVRGGVSRKRRRSCSTRTTGRRSASSKRRTR